MKKAKIIKPRAMRQVCYGYTGLWNEGSIGWFGFDHLQKGTKSRKYAARPNKQWNLNASENEDRAYLCRVTIEVLKDKRGRFITIKPNKDRAHD